MPAGKAREATSALAVRRQQLVRELARVNRQIAQTQGRLARIEERMAVIKPAHPRAA